MHWKNYYLWGKEGIMGKKYNKNTAQESKVSEAAYAYSRAGLGKFVYFDDYSLVKKSREGINTNVFYLFSENAKIPEKTLAAIINLSPRTISNYRNQDKMMEAHYSEHLLKLIALFEKGKEYLGTTEEFKIWLEKPFWNSEEKPSDYLNTSGGVDLLMDRLERMAQGYPL